MKKKIFLLVCLSVVLLSACGKNTVSTSAEMMEVLAEQHKVIGNMEEIGRIKSENALLVIGATSSGGKIIEYYAAEFSEVKDGQYQFEHRVTITQNYQSGFGKWKGGYAIVCNHPDVNTIHFALSANGKYKEENLEAAEIPSVYFIDLPDFDLEPNYSMQISWLDSNGNEIW